VRSAGDILKLFLDRNTAEQADFYQQFFTGWQQVVGERIAAHSEVKDIQNGVVLVEVDHPGWIQMIQLKQAQFVETLKKKYPDLNIRGLRLQLPWKVGGPAARQSASRNPAAKREYAAESSGVAERSKEGDGQDREAPADPLIRGALDRLGKAIEKRAEDE